MSAKYLHNGAKLLHIGLTDGSSFYSKDDGGKYDLTLIREGDAGYWVEVKSSRGTLLVNIDYIGAITVRRSDHA